MIMILKIIHQVWEGATEPVIPERLRILSESWKELNKQKSWFLTPLWQMLNDVNRVMSDNICIIVRELSVSLLILENKQIVVTKCPFVKIKRFVKKEDNIRIIHGDEYSPLLLHFILNLYENKKISKLKLNVLNKSELQRREMNKLVGGGNYCICGCSINGSASIGGAGMSVA